MRKGLVATLFVGLITAIGGCGGGDDSSTTTTSEQPDGAALVEPFNALAQQAYDDAGKDRDEDFGAGTTIDSCFIADDETAAAMGDAAGFDLTFRQESSYLQG